MTAGSSDGPQCDRCDRPHRGEYVYTVQTDQGELSLCLRCALRHPPLVRRSLIVALVVGSILTAINQGDGLLAGDLSASLAWKIPLTFAVPYCVATFGAITNSRRRVSAD